MRLPVGSMAGNRICAQPATNIKHEASNILVMIDFRVVRLQRMIPVPWFADLSTSDGQRSLSISRTGWRLAFG